MGPGCLVPPLLLLFVSLIPPAAMAYPCEQAPAMPMPCAGGGAIPNDILLDIFMRLPAKSVGRCRCLSRTWAAALAPSDDFTDRHFRAANRRPSLFVLPVPSAGVTAVYAWSPDKPHGTTLVAFPRRPMRNAGTRPCRGLVVMEEEDPPARAGDGAVYYVCNPSTGQMTALPEGRPLPLQPGGYAARDPRCYDNLGIGYNEVSGKFKVVRVCRYNEYFYADCDVYVVDDAFCWRPAAGDAEVPEEVGYISSYEASVSAQGHLYWMSDGAEGMWKEKHVISFSLSDEKFGVIYAPHYRDYSLTELEGRACLFSSLYQECYDIWLLRDDKAWDLRCRIDLARAAPEVRRFMACQVRPLAFIDGGHRIIFRPGIQSMKDSKPVHQLCTYTPATGAIEELLADGCLVAQPSENGHATMKALVYEESLVSTGRPHEDILFSSASTRALCVALQRLPSAILGKLKLVCRAWRAMIESDRFVKLHSHYARTRRSSPLRVFFPDANTEGRRTESLLHASPKLLERRVVSCKPCHGLLLVTSSQNHKDVRLLSPVIDEEIILGFPSGNTTGMGYDEVMEEHVLVTMVNVGHGSSAAMECHLWRLKEDVRRIVPSPLSIRVQLDLPPVYIDGKMYWMGEPPGQNSQSIDSWHGMIMALDIHTESFEVLSVPHADDGCRMLVVELAGRLCVAQPCAHTESMTIWSKNDKAELVDNKCNDDDCGQEWTREHVIELWRWPEFSPKTAAGLIVPVEVDTMGGGQILLDTGREVGLYDPREQTMHTVYSLKWRHGEHTDKFVATALWEDSMVPPRPMRCEPERWYRDV